MDAASHTVTLDTEAGPCTVTVTVITVERKQEPSVFGGDSTGLYAQVNVPTDLDDSPNSYFLSRLVGEVHWTVDALILGNGFPVWSNGFGARYLTTRVVPPQVAALLDDEAKARGLADEVGPDTPLKLSQLDCPPAD